MSKPLNISLRSASTLEEAEEIVSFLKNQNIVSKITRDSGDLDYVIQGEAPINKFEIHINEDDQQKAESVLADVAKESLNTIDRDYYLFSFSDDELVNILIQKNEWSEFDVLLSKKILDERNVSVNQSEIDRKKNLRDLELEKPEGGQVGWIIFGYIAALFGGFIGILLGYSLWLSNKKLPNGKKVPAYNEHIRKHGKIIFYSGIVIFVILLVFRLGEMLTQD